MPTHGITPDFRGGVHLFILTRHTPSVQSRVNRVTQVRTDGAHCRESAGTGPVVLKVVPVTGAAILQATLDQLMYASLSHCATSGCGKRERTIIGPWQRKDSTNDRMAGLPRGSVCGWYKVCLVGKGNHTLILRGTCTRFLGRISSEPNTGMQPNK